MIGLYVLSVGETSSVEMGACCQLCILLQETQLTWSRVILSTRSRHVSDSLLSARFHIPDCLLVTTFSIPVPLSSFSFIASLIPSPLLRPIVRSAILGCRLNVRILSGCFSFPSLITEVSFEVVLPAVDAPETTLLVGRNGSGRDPGGNCE
jgi:hypothetical protein